MNRDVHDWLGQLGLDQYGEVFAREAIDLDTLGQLTDADLRELGVAMGHRKRMLNALRGALTAEPAAFPESAERRQVSVMFCDLVGYTALSQRLDAEELHELIVDFHSACRRGIERFDGFVARYLGDGSLTLFGYPRAFEANAERAVLAALAVVEEVAGVNAAYRRRLDATAEVRVSIATGNVVVGDLAEQEGSFQEWAAVGETPNLAARLQNLTPPGCIVVSASTHDLIADRFECKDLGAHEAKGFVDGVQAFQVLGESHGSSRFEQAHARGNRTPLVGRAPELQRLKEKWDESRSGNPQTVVLRGDPGIGKSRLVDAVSGLCVAASGLRIQWQCSEFHMSKALYPLAQELLFSAGSQPREAEESKKRKLDQLLIDDAALDRADADVVLNYLSLIVSGGDSADVGEGADTQKRVTLASLVKRIERLCRLTPVLLVFEDAHWSDPTSVEFLLLLKRRLKGLPVMTLVTARPEWRSCYGNDALIMDLQRLSVDDVREIVVAVGGDGFADDAISSIVERTDGVPLFIEEVTRGMVELGEEAAGASGPKKKDRGRVPATLYDSLMSRLDRVPASREVAQCAAVIGREFNFDLLKDIYPRSEDELRRGLRELQGSLLIFAHTARADESYSFRHALIQDTAYESLLKRRRRKLHGQIAGALAKNTATAATESALIAQHYSWADMVEEAADAWSLASRQAIAKSSFAEAVKDSQSGLEVVADMPPGADRDARELELRLRLGQALLASRGWSASETGAAYERAFELSRGLGGERVLPVMYGLYTFYFVRGEYERSLGVAEQCLEQARGPSAEAIERLGLRWRGLAQLLQGKLGAARENLSAVVEPVNPEEHANTVLNYGTNPRSSTQSFLALCDAVQGHRTRALERCEQSVAYAEQLGSPFDRCHQFTWSAMVCMALDEQELLEHYVEKVREVSRQHHFQLWEVASVNFGAIADIAREHRKSIDTFTRGMHVYRHDIGANHMVVLSQTEFSRRVLEIGQVDRARQAIEAAKSVLELTGERCYEPEVFRVDAEVNHAEGGAHVHERLLEALASARQRDAKLWELKTATSLAGWYQRNDDTAQARATLTPVVEALSNQNELVPLARAQGLLDAL